MSEMKTASEGTDYGDRVYGRNRDVVIRKIAGETFLIPIRDNIADMQRIFSLNPVGECIWQELDGRKSLQEVCDRVLARFSAARETVMTDAAEFIADLEGARLIAAVQ